MHGGFCVWRRALILPLAIDDINRGGSLAVHRRTLHTARASPAAPGRIPSIFEMMRTIYRNPLEMWGEPSYEEMWIETSLLNERSLIVNDPGLIRHVLVDNARNYRMATVRQLDPAADPARRPADGRGRGVEALAQGDGAGVHAAPHLRLCGGRCWRAPRRLRALRGGARTARPRYRARHDGAHLRYPRRDAVFRRDRDGEPAISPAIRRPLLRHHGPRRSARPAERAATGCRASPACSGRKVWLFRRIVDRHDGDAQEEDRARRRRAR